MWLNKNKAKKKAIRAIIKDIGDSIKFKTKNGSFEFTWEDYNIDRDVEKVIVAYFTNRGFKIESERRLAVNNRDEKLRIIIDWK